MRSVYSYFGKKWRDREADPPLSPPDGAELADVEDDPLPSRSKPGFDAPAAHVPTGT